MNAYSMENIDFSEDSASELMQILLDRGYFHSGGNEPNREQDQKSHRISTYTFLTQKQQSRAFPEKDCDIVQTHDSRYLTKIILKQKLCSLLSESGGRLTKADASSTLAVNIDAIACVIPENTTMICDDLLTDQYLDKQIQLVGSRVSKSDSGCIALSEVAFQILHLPIEFVLSTFENRIHLLDARIITLHGAKYLVSSNFDANERARILGVLCALTSPAQLDTLSLGDLSYVLPVVRELCRSQEVAGVLREPPGSMGVFTPLCYENIQRESVDDIFRTQGYISLEKCQAMGIAACNMGTFLKKSFPSAICLSSSVIAPNIVISPLISAIQDCLEESSILDLKTLVAEEMIANEIDLRRLLCEHVFPQVPTSWDSGELVLLTGEALFVSRRLINRLSSGILPPLIECFAKRRALEINNSTNSSDGNNDLNKKSSNKGKKKFDAKSLSLPSNRDCKSLGVVPLFMVAAKVAEEEPELANIQRSHNDVFEVNPDEELFLWEPDDESKLSGGPLYDFCRIAFFTEEFRNACAQAVEANLVRLVSTPTIVHRKDDASRIQCIEGAFEDPRCFNTACFQLQVHSKFLDYLATTEILENVMFACSNAFLDGCCVHFAKRIIQYCLFKNELEGVFTFERNHNEKEENKGDESIGLPSYCCPVDTTQTFFPHYTLHCLEEANDNLQNSLASLKAALSANLGVNLARTWILCAGKDYSGGSRTKGGEGTDFVHPGNASEFMAHVEDNCLPICGIPFKKLDKKSEKQYLLTRRQQLTTKLGATEEADQVLELTIHILFQQIKGLCAFGLPVDSLLPILCQEKKISATVAKVLTSLHVSRKMNELSDSNSNTLSMMERVRAIGLCKDVSKYEIKT